MSHYLLLHLECIFKLQKKPVETGLKTAGYDLMERSRQVKVMTPSFQRAVMRP